MNTLNKLVYDIKNIAYGGSQSDDTPINDRQVAYWANQGRSILVEQTMSSTKSIPDALIQHIECIELECITPEECCDISVSIGEKILRSTQKIPVTIQRSGKNTIISVSSVDKTVAFAETSFYRQKMNKHNKYTSKKARWFLKNNYLYIIQGFVMDKVSLAGVFDDPTEVSEFNNCDGSPCFTWDSEYPVTNKIAKIITDMVLKEKMGYTLQADRDDSNDGSGDDASKQTTRRRA